MAFDEIARASISLEAQINEGQVRAAAERAAQIAERQLARSTARIQQNLNRVNTRNITRTSDAFVDLSARITQTAERAIPRLITRLTQLGVAGAAAFTFFGVKAAANLETLQASLKGLENVLGTTAEEAFRRLQQFAAVTPFQVQDLTAAVIRLSSALGTDLRESLDVLTILGNAGAAVGATGEQINAAALALAQIAARGKLSAQELNQLANALPNISRIAVFDELAERMRTTRSEVQALAEQGLIPAGVALETILKVAQEVPGALGAMDRQARTFTGVMSTLRDNINLFLGQAFLPLIQSFARFVPGLLGTQAQITALADTVGQKLLQAFQKVLPSIEEIIPALTRLFGAFLESLPAISDLIVASTPIIIALIDGFAGFVTIMTTLEPVLRDVLDTISALLNPLGAVRDTLVTINNLPIIGRLVPDSLVNNAEKTEEATKGIAASLQGVVPDLSRFGTAAESVSDRLKGVIGSIDKIDTANKALTTSTRALTQATENLHRLERERATLLADTARDVRELAEAEEELTRIRFTLRDLDEEEAEIQEKLNELRTPASARDLAEADRDIERAKLALNQALREEAALNNTLTKQQKESVNLQGLTLDQIRAKLANIRATNAAQKKTETGEATLEEQQTEARLNVADAQDTLNKALESRTALEDKVKNNATDIRELEERLLTISLDRAGALRDEATAQDELNKLRAGDTSRAKEIREIDEDIKQAKQDQATAAQNVKDRQFEIRQLVADTLGDERVINGLLLERIELNKTLIRQNPELFAATLQQLLGIALPALQKSGAPGAPGASALARQIADALLNNPNALKDLLRKAGVPGFAEGGLITSPTLAQIGERFRPELVLPLSQPAKVWSLLSRNLPKYPGALAAASAALSPAGPPQPAYRLLGAGRGSQDTRNANRELADEIADALIRKGINLSGDIRIEAPVNVTSPVPDAYLLARRVAREIERGLH
jgi:tape measure domain-containing protein